jgi:single-strand DNA-binding protein
MTDGINKVLLLGNLGDDPELRSTATGQALLRMRVATTESFLDANKQRRERTEWHTVVLWGKRAEPLSKILQKGSRVLIEGRIHTSSYEKDGTKRTTTEVVADDLWLAGDARRAPGVRVAPPPPLPVSPPPSAADDVPF